MDRDEPLQRDGDRHQNGPGHRHHVQRVQHVREEEDVEVGGQGETLAESLQDGADLKR